MKTQVDLVLFAMSVALVAGCVGTPTQRGTWTGVVGTTNLYDRTKPHEAYVLNIEDGPRANEGAKCRGVGRGGWPHEFLDAHPILVGQKDRVLRLPEWVGHRVQVKGTIYVGSPVDPNDTEVILHLTPPSHRGTNSFEWDWIHVIEISNPQKHIVDLGTAARFEKSLHERVRLSDFIGIISITNATTTNSPGVISRYGFGTIERMIKGVHSPNQFRVRQNISHPAHIWKRVEKGRYLMFGFYSGASIAPFGYYGLVPISRNRSGVDVVSWPKPSTLADAIGEIEKELNPGS
jgi:hypothetical protein